MCQQGQGPILVFIILPAPSQVLSEYCNQQWRTRSGRAVSFRRADQMLWQGVHCVISEGASPLPACPCVAVAPSASA